MGTAADPAAGPRIRITPQYRFDADDPAWFDMTEAPVGASEGTRALPLGPHVFVWNSIVDAGGHQGTVYVRIVAAYEATETIRRRFRTRELAMTIDNRLAATVAGLGAEPPSDVSTTPVDLRPDGASFVVADAGSNIVERVDASGVVTRLAGYGVPGETVGAGRHPGVARLPNVVAVEVDPAGTLYTNHESSLLVTNTGAAPVSFGLVDGADTDADPDTVVVPPATIAAARVPGLAGARGLRLHPTGVLLVANALAEGDDEIVAVNPQDPLDPASTSVTVAGVVVGPGETRRIAGGGDDEEDGAAALAARISGITCLAVGPDGEIYFAESTPPRVRVLAAGGAAVVLGGRSVSPGAVDTVAGGAGTGARGDRGPARDAELDRPVSIAVSPQRGVFIADRASLRVRMANLGTDPIVFAETTVAPAAIDTVAGGGILGVGSRARALDLRAPSAVAIDARGNLLVGDRSDVILVNGDTVAIAAYGQNAGPGRTTRVYDAAARGGLPLSGPRAAHMLAPTGAALYFTDRTTVRVLNLARTAEIVGGAVAEPGRVAIVAGGSVPGFSGDGGSARAAAFSAPSALANDGPQRLLVADTGNERVRFVHLGDPRSDAPLTAFGVTVAAGDVATIVGGAAGPLGDDGDGLPPASCTLSRPEGLAYAPSGLLWIADTGHHRIRVVNPGPGDAVVAGVPVAAGTIATVIGDGAAGFTADGPGPWRIDTPTALAVERRVLFFAEPGNARIRVLNFSAASMRVAGVDVPPGEVRSIVGTGVRGNFGDLGRANAALIDAPCGFFYQTRNSEPLALLFSDSAQHVVRVVNLGDGDLQAVSDSTGRVTLTVPGGSIATIAGGPNLPGQPNLPGFDGDGDEPARMRFAGPLGVAVAQYGNTLAHLFVCDEDNDRLRRCGAPPTRTPFQNP